MPGPSLAQPDPGNDFQDAFVMAVAASFARVTGQSLADAAELDPARLTQDGWGRCAWDGPFALLTHRGDVDATLNYANAFALTLWALDWEAMAVMPSRLTAPPGDQPLREDFMRQVATQGFAAGYRGRRISRDGRLFEIRDATVWRLRDEKGADFGVGAFFKHIAYL